jgi:hypothetical protein
MPSAGFVGVRPRGNQHMPFAAGMQVVTLIDEIVGLAAYEGLPGEPSPSCPFQPLNPSTDSGSNDTTNGSSSCCSVGGGPS